MKKPFLLISVLIVLVVLGGCIPQNLFPKGNLKVVVNIPAQLQSMMNDAKLATAGFDISTMKISLSKGTEVLNQTVNLTAGQNSAETTFSNLSLGQWTVNVEVSDQQDHLIYTGTGTGTVAANTTSTVTIALTPNNGGLQVQVTFPEQAGITSGEVVLTHALNNANIPNQVAGDLVVNGNMGTVQFTDLYPTSWQMYVTLQNTMDEIVAVGEDTIEILPGRTIAAAIELTVGGEILIDIIWDLPPAKPLNLGCQFVAGGVNLTWTANTEPNIAGYRVYRSNSETGAKHLLNTDLVTGTEYLDTAALDGENWYWVRAVAATGLASVLSDPVNLTVSPEFGGVEGYVYYYDRTDHSGIQISLSGFTAVTDSNGYFCFESVPVAEHIFVAKADGYYTSSLVCVIEANVMSQLQQLYLYPVEVYGSVSGYAKFLDGSDHSGIAVQVRTLAGQELPDLIAVTDSTGYFSFPQVPVDAVANESTYIFTAFKLNDPSGYSSDSQQVTVAGGTHTAIETEFVLRFAAVEVMIFADDVTPWDSEALPSMLASMNVTYQIYTSNDIPTVTLHLDQIVWIANDQPQTFYNVYAQNQSKFDQFVYNGGTLLFEACDEGWNAGSLIDAGGTLPGGVVNNLYYCYTNTVVNPTHPMMTGVPMELSGTYASHNWFSNLPAGSTVLTVDDQNYPTLVEYRYNLGRVIATGQPLEFHWNNNQNLKNIYPNMIYYTFDWSVPEPVEAGVSNINAVSDRTSGN